MILTLSKMSISLPYYERIQDSELLPLKIMRIGSIADPEHAFIFIPDREK